MSKSVRRLLILVVLFGMVDCMLMIGKYARIDICPPGKVAFYMTSSNGSQFLGCGDEKFSKDGTVELENVFFRGR